MRRIPLFSPAQRRAALHVHTTVWTIVLIAFGCPAGCAPPGEECTREDNRCVGSALETCIGPATAFDRATEHDPHNSWYKLADCGSADRCKVAPAYTAKTGVEMHDAFCVLSSAPDPACTSDGPHCEGTTAVDCSHGFASAKHACRSCSDGTCIGGLQAACTTTSDCARGLVCRTSLQDCEIPCSCPEGAECDACRSTENDAPGANHIYKWQCIKGFCFGGV